MSQAQTKRWPQYAEFNADGFTCRADVNNPAEIQGMFGRIKQEFGTLDVLVSNARVDLGTGFYQSPLDIPLEKFELALDSQVRAFHLLVREMAGIPSGRRRRAHIIAISYSPSARTGSWQPWCAMGAAKAAQDASSRYYAVALAPRGLVRQTTAYSAGCLRTCLDDQAMA
jgi:NAD(P)-dependent dehydrogenase (short-subunit alcohol dehydrogenase family)